MEAYCMKCREKRPVQNPVSVTMKNGRPLRAGPAESAVRPCSELARVDLPLQQAPAGA